MTSCVYHVDVVSPFDNLAEKNKNGRVALLALQVRTDVAMKTGGGDWEWGEEGCHQQS